VKNENVNKHLCAVIDAIRFKMRMVCFCYFRRSEYCLLKLSSCRQRRGRRRSSERRRQTGDYGSGERSGCKLMRSL
jgi:hypothetical protein